VGKIKQTDTEFQSTDECEDTLYFDSLDDVYGFHVFSFIRIAFNDTGHPEEERTWVASEPAQTSASFDQRYRSNQDEQIRYRLLFGSNERIIGRIENPESVHTGNAISLMRPYLEREQYKNSS
jgi:hypothetical protein